MTDPPRTIFLSYASEDGAAAIRLGGALRAAGLGVWIDQSELRGGDTWDSLLRQRIRECALFIPIISAQTQARLEGYFRLEWRLAVDRTQLMADGRAFIVPVTIDAVPASVAHVPDAFRAVQWTNLPGGEVTPAFIERVRELLATSSRAAPSGNGAAAAPAGTRSPRRGRWPFLVGAAAIAAAAVLLHRYAHLNSPAPGAPLFAPPAHSVAVLAFANMSGDPKEDYFSDGLAEELLNTLAEVRDLKVAARTSSFLFKGKPTAVGDIARQLNVAVVLEGSVRRDKSHVRVATQLIDALSGYQLWSQTYDRDFSDVLAVQSDIAASVAGALKVKLLQYGPGGSIGGTGDAKAFDAYLRAEELARQQPAPEVHADALAAYDQALALDHEFANAYAGRGYARILYVLNGSLSPAEVHRQIEQGLADARKAAQLAPALGFAHAIIGYGLSGELNFVGAAAEFEQALALSPGDARVYTHSAFFLSQIGRADESVASARRAVELDPLSFKTRAVLSYVYYWARRYREAIEAGHRAGATEHSHPGFLGWIGLAQAGLGEYQVARSTCDLPNPEWTTLLCLAVVDDKLGQHADALSALETMKKNFGDDTSYQIAEIYAQWGDVPHALEALEAADKAADPGLFSIKVDPLLDPLRHEPRFRAVQAHIRFPD